MDYKKKYENALEWARQVINGECGFIRKDVEEVFPELKESEGERIRKDILAFIRREGQHIDKYKWHKWIAWLEKQCEQNYEFHGIAESRPAKGKLKELCQELSQSEVTKKSDQDDIDALEQAMYALESFIVEDKPDKCFAGHYVPFIKAIEKLKSLKERLSL